MNRLLTVFLTIVFLSMSKNTLSQFNCYSHNYFFEQMQTNASFRKNQELLEKETRQLLAQQGLAKPAAAPPYIIPVVFHIIYTTPVGNISDAQILDQMAILNKEFNRLQADTALTPAAFKPLASAFSVEFRLATIDPDGKCTNGINRIYSTLSNCSVVNDDVKSVSYWPSNKYLNIWITQSMRYSGSNQCSGGGYATFPGGSALTDGINIRGDLISNIGTSATNPIWGNFKGRYLIHELGHWFNLRHIWGDAICGNDQVADTPPAVFSNSNCPSFPHNPNNSCGGNANGEMFCNYMDYTDGICLNMFTAGQVARMTAAITSSVSGRNNLWSASNLNATGTSNPYNYPVACAAVPAVLQQPVIVACQGDSVTFTDKSYGGSVTQRLWDFDGQPASSYSDSVVKVKYASPGIYSFSLSTTYLSSSKTKTFKNKVHILSNSPDPNFFVPFSESYEQSTDFDKWTVVNHDNDAIGWELNSSTAYSGANSISIKNYGSKAPQIDEIISPVYNMDAVENPTLTFMVNFSTRNNDNSDQLQIFMSSNCGKTWSSIYLKSAGVLKSMLIAQPNSYTPAPTSAEWRQDKIVLNPLLAKGNLRFKFTFTGGGGNNIYIDDINIDGISTVGLKKNSSPDNLLFYPQPVGGKLFIRSSDGGLDGAEVIVKDVLGKTCLGRTLTPYKLNEAELDLSTLQAGVYFISIKKASGAVVTKKISVDPEN